MREEENDWGMRRRKREDWGRGGGGGGRGTKLSLHVLLVCIVLQYLCTLCRGIDVVRNRIKMFAHQKVTLPKGRHKIIILDEADRYGSTRTHPLIVIATYVSPLA